MLISTPMPAAAKPITVAPPAAAAAAKAFVVDKLLKTTASEAMLEVDQHLAQLSKLTVGGPTPEGAQGAKAATALLTDASMLLQHAHVKAMEELRQIAGDLHLRLMSSVSGLAFVGGQVALAGQSKTPVSLADVAAGPIAETKETMHDVIAALTPKVPVSTDTPTTEAPSPAPGVAPPGYQPRPHVTGPGAGREPDPA